MCAYTPDSQSPVKENKLHIFKQKIFKKKKVQCVTKVPTVLINVEFLEGGGKRLAEELYCVSASSSGHHRNPLCENINQTAVTSRHQLLSGSFDWK